MNVTKYPQSCLLIEKDGRRIVIDPGNFFASEYSLEQLGPLSAVLYTHRHGDHCDAALFEKIKSAPVPSYGNADVQALLGEGVTKVEDGQQFTVGGFDILPHDIDHFQVPGVEMPQNTGYIIDGIFFHPGDGYKNNGAKADNFAVPIAGKFSLSEAKDFVVSVGAKRVIPIHYTNQELYPINPEDFVKLAKDSAEIILLDDGESVEL